MWLVRGHVLEHPKKRQRKVKSAHNTDSVAKIKQIYRSSITSVLWPLPNRLANSVLLNHNDRAKYKCQDFTLVPGSCHIAILILFSLPRGHFGRFRGFQPNLTGSTQTAGALPRAQPDYVNKAASSTGELRPGLWSSGNRHELALYAPRGNFLQKQTSDTARGNCFPLEISVTGACLL